MIGQTIGNWTVLSSTRDARSQKYHLCRCVCGTEKPVLENNLKAGKSLSCGCLRFAQSEIKPGAVFGRLTVLRYSHKSSRQARMYLCKCLCGTTNSYIGSLLKNGNTLSCGCFRSESLQKRFLKPNNASAVATLIDRFQRSAHERGYDWGLTKAQAERLLRSACHYCGDRGGNTYRNNKTKSPDFKYNGIDRVDNSKGYLLDNVVPCCGTCNVAKGTLPYDDFIRWISRIAVHHFTDPRTRSRSTNRDPNV